MKWSLVVVLSGALLAACGGDDGDDGGGGASGMGGDASSVCYMVCDAQEAAEVAGNCPGIGLQACRGLCGNGTNSCQAQFDAMHECWLTGEFMCGLVSAESDADCQEQENAYFDCLQ